MHAADVARAALCEAGRPDLAAIAIWIQQTDAAAIEVNARILTEDEWAIIDKAEAIGCAYAGIDANRGLDPVANATTPVLDGTQPTH